MEYCNCFSCINGAAHLCTGGADLDVTTSLATAIGDCDACGGTGEPISGKPCMCGGSGKAVDAMRYLRERLHGLSTAAVVLIDASRDLLGGIEPESGLSLRDNTCEAIKLVEEKLF